MSPLTKLGNFVTSLSPKLFNIEGRNLAYNNVLSVGQMCINTFLLKSDSGFVTFLEKHTYRYTYVCRQMLNTSMKKH